MMIILMIVMLIMIIMIVMIVMISMISMIININVKKKLNIMINIIDKLNHIQEI